ncbi:MAG: SRPBCC family protein, partial [Solirubrobacteraceae bacterium]
MPSATDPLRHEVRIEAPPEIVFAYFTDPARIVEWMGVAATLDPRPGGIFELDANGRDVVRGEYVALQPPHRIVFTWGFAGGERAIEAGSTQVEVTLQPDGDATLLTLRHHGLAGGARGAHDEGWT